MTSLSYSKTCTIFKVGMFVFIAHTFVRLTNHVLTFFNVLLFVVLFMKSSSMKQLNIFSRRLKRCLAYEGCHCA